MRPFAVLLAALLTPAVAGADTTIPSKALFGPSSYRLSTAPEVAQFLDRVAEKVKSSPDAFLRVEVHADERPGALDNTVLADRRAKEILKELKKRGLKRRTLGSDAVGHSGVQPTPTTSRIVFDFVNDATVDVPPTWR